MKHEIAMIDLGYANGWGKETPEIVQKCPHREESRSVGRCLREYYCLICGFKYLVDSSD